MISALIALSIFLVPSLVMAITHDFTPKKTAKRVKYFNRNSKGQFITNKPAFVVGPDRR